MTSRRILLHTFLATLAVLGVAIGVLTPWQPLGSEGGVVRPDLNGSFTAAEIARAAGFRSALGIWPYLGIALVVAVPWVVLVTCARSRRLRASSGVVHGIRRFGLILAVVLAVAVTQRVVAAPTSVHSELELRRYGLSTQDWSGWLGDQALALGLACSVTSAGIALALWLVRRAPARWPWLLAGAAALVTVLGSLVYPVVVEPAFNAHTPLSEGPFRQRVERLADAAGFADIRVAVSNASIRTTGENAHVSGLGATRWIVLDDTLVARAKSDPDAALAVVAHELGHVRHQDVLRGTLIGATGAGAFVLLLALALTTPMGRRICAPQSDRSADLVRVVVLVLAIATTVPYAAAPLSNLISRRIEASADVYALQVTGKIPAFVRMQHDLATSNLSRLDPRWWQTMMFATHPDPVWRIAQARTWQRDHPHR
jgi:STE24 endopeptidase